LRQVTKQTRIAPPLKALATGQDRLLEKRLFERLGIRTTRYSAVSSRAELTKALAKTGLPALLKTRRLGYDGKGQAVLRTAADVESAWAQLGQQELLCEEWVPFDYEVSIIGARARGGEIAIYPLNRNVHAEGILRLTTAPAGPPALARAAARHLRRMLEYFRYVGVLNIEFFVRNGQLIANEIAPRVHNSGHWTIEGAETSQFENHLRAILGLPLGSTAARGHCAMVNVIGAGSGRPLSRQQLVALPGHWHDYGKEPRPGRKLGHITVVTEWPAQRDRLARQILRRVGAPPVDLT
jgi:5-(carboxyamino)imidazole ribonucleotide synthase